METRSNAVAVGAFVIIGMIALALFVMWLGRASVSEVSQRYTIYFSESVSGLQEGSRVLFRGVPVGQVAVIALEQEPPFRVDVTVELREETPILTTTTATLSSQGLTGIAQIELEGDMQDGAELEAASGQRYPVIPSRQSALGAVLTSFPDLLERATVMIDRASEFVSPENEALLRELTVEMLTIVRTFSSRSDEIGHLIDDGSALVTNLDGLVSELRVDTARISDDVATMIADVTENADAAAAQFSEMSASINETAKTLDAILNESAEGITDFTSGGLNDISLLVTDLRALSQDFSRLARRLERSPSDFIFGNTGQGVPAP